MRIKSLVATVLGLGACSAGSTEPVTGTQSLQVDLVSPSDPGSEAARLADSALTTTIDITALDANGNVDTSFNNDLQVYEHYLGTLSPYITATPLQTVHMSAGVAMNQTITLPLAFGPTEIWLDDGQDTTPTFATGTTTTLWYRDPFIRDIQKPRDETALSALVASPLQNKNVLINSTRNGATGKLVVTSVFAQGYTLADVNCPSGAAPCTAGDYDTIEVFSFSAAKDNKGNLVHEGEVIDGFAGGISEFDGLTEVGFPQTFASATPTVDPSLEPPPAILDGSWFTNIIMFERNEAGALQINGATVCPLDADYATYKQWKLSLDGNCSNSKTLVNIISAGVTQLDPTNCVGKILPRVIGMLRPVNIGSFNVWIIYPRSPADFQLPSGDALCTLPSA